MNISEEEFDRLSLQERSVLFLTNAAYQVLQYVRAGYVQVKVDVAFANPDGLVVYSYNQDSEVNQYLFLRTGCQGLLILLKKKTRTVMSFCRM